jgi:hypothetical protein
MHHQSEGFLPQHTHGLTEIHRMKLSNLPSNFVKFYDLTNLANNDGTICVKIQKGIYGLPQAGILAQNLLK